MRQEPEHTRTADGSRPPRAANPAGWRRRGIGSGPPVPSRLARSAGDLAVIGIPLSVLYAGTMARDLGTIDSGELAGAAATLGVAHPTGYPLYTLLGRLAVLALPLRPIVAVNLLSLLIAIAAAWATARLLRRWIPSSPGFGAWAAGLWIGTSAVFWAQAVGNEVYGLHLFFAAILVERFLRLQDADAGPRDLWLAAWFTGLAFAHHLSTAFLVPAGVLALGWRLLRGPDGGCAGRDAIGAAGRIRSHAAALGGWPALLLAAGAMALAWSVVLYLPIRSAQEPMFDWGDPTSWDRFWRHVLAAQYRVWMFESAERWEAQFTGYFGSLPSRFSWPVVVLSAASLAVSVAYRAVRRRMRRTAILLAVLLGTAAWAASYDIHDVAPYFLPADLVVAVIAAGGLTVGTAARSSRGRGRSSAAPRTRTDAAGWPARVAGTALAAAVAAWQAAAHYPELDRSEDHAVRAHAEAVLASVPPNAVLLSRHWDGFVSGALYLQAVEGLRRDVAIVDPELLRRSWYFPQIRRWNPGLLDPVEDRVSAFLEPLAAFEAGRPYDPATIERRYREAIAAIATAHRPARPAAYTPDVEAPVLGAPSGGAPAPVPEGLVYLLRDGPQDVAATPPPDPVTLAAAGIRPADPIHDQILGAWEQMLVSRLQFLEFMGRDAEIGPWADALDEVREIRRSPSAPPR